MVSLQSVQSMTREQLEAKVLAMSQAAQRKITLKVSEKGAVSLYGMGKFPVTLYAAQWERVMQEIDHIRDFIRDNEGLLKRKGE